MKEKKKNQVLEGFVVLEGLDGSGTTTQLSLLDKKLDEKFNGILHYCTSEPTCNSIGRVIRSILKHEISVDSKTVALLFAADRNEHLMNPNSGIISRLKQKNLVISDRYLFSSLAYQSLKCGFDFVYALNKDFPLPQHLIFLDTPICLSQQRLSVRGEKELFDYPEIQPEILINYEKAFSLFRDTEMQIHHIDGSLKPQKVHDNCWNIIKSLPILKE